MKIEEIENLTLGIGTFKKFTNNLAFASAVSSQCKLRSHLETLLASLYNAHTFVEPQSTITSYSDAR